MGNIKAFWNMPGNEVPEWLAGKVMGTPGDKLTILTGKGSGDVVVAKRGQFIVAGQTPIIHVVDFELYHDIIHPFVQK